MSRCSGCYFAVELSPRRHYVSHINQKLDKEEINNGLRVCLFRASVYLPEGEGAWEKGTTASAKPDAGLDKG